MKGFFEHEYLAYKKNHMSNLVALARVDGSFDAEESEFLMKIGIKYGLKPKHIASILSSKKELIPTIPTSHEKKMEQLHDLVGMMLADGKVKADEITFCESMAALFGFQTQVIHKLISHRQHNFSDFEAWNNLLEEAQQLKVNGL